VALAAGGVASADAPGGSASPGTALVIDASLARDGRDLVDARLEGLDADVRIPRSAREARTNVRYFDSLGYRVVVAGARSEAAAAATGTPTALAGDIDSAVAAVRR
jgi:hypothetical protein